MIRWSAITLTITVLFACNCHECAPYDSEVGCWREVSGVAEIRMQLTGLERRWLRSRAENRSHFVGWHWAPAQVAGASPKGHRLLEHFAPDPSTFGPLNVNDLTFYRSGQKGEALRLLRLSSHDASTGSPFEYYWSKNGTKLLLFGLDCEMGPALIIYDIVGHEVVWIRPRHQWSAWLKR